METEQKNGNMKMLPSAVDAEESVLGTVLLKGIQIYEKVLPWIKDEEVFYGENHQEIWKACRVLYKHHQTIDTITVMNKLKEMKKESVADGYYLTGLTGNVGIASNVITHAKIVYEKYVQRKTALSAYSLFDVAHDKYYDIQSQLLEHERLIDMLR